MFPFPPFPFSFSHSAELNQVVATVLQSVITAPQGENYKRKEHQTTSTDHLISGRSQRKIYCDIQNTCDLFVVDSSLHSAVLDSILGFGRWRNPI